MSIKADFHLHSNFSGDSNTSMEEMIQKAIVLGLDTLCFTEHHDEDFPYTDSTHTDFFLLNVDSYLHDLLYYKDKYSDKLKILCGVELGIQAYLVDAHLRFTKAHAFDFIIGSSHLCNKKDPYYSGFYEGRSEDAAYLEYFETVLENVTKYKYFDVCGHLDYIVRYGPTKNENYSYQKFSNVIDQILITLIENEKGIELNTGGFKAGLGDSNPSTDIIRRYKQLGGEIITVGSDAHKPEYLSYKFDKASEILKACGFKYYTVFENRIPEFKML